MASDGVVVELPVRPPRPKLCSECVHGYLGVGGVFCREYAEDIWNEKVAEDCGSFDPQ